ncbi:MAG: L,D-transpeptidase family protein [Dissulfurispiraceae bacterium]|jgi:murein L,D-transpeptidase YafK|nr:L,D-transpeptidase family protein [Dissulfurispiraceae bacterium]
MRPGFITRFLLIPLQPVCCLFAVCSFVLIFFAVSDASVERADRVIVIKHKRVMLLIQNSSIIRTYKISLGKQPEGHKKFEGDQRTPEGSYTLDYRKLDSKFYKAIHISYPNENDARSAGTNGRSAGGQIMIHGLPKGYADVGKVHRMFDWTDGCIAVSNDEMDEIWGLVADGTPIDIQP